jgi:hypothetical protein
LVHRFREIEVARVSVGYKVIEAIKAIGEIQAILLIKELKATPEIVDLLAITLQFLGLVENAVSVGMMVILEVKEIKEIKAIL